MGQGTANHATHHALQIYLMITNRDDLEPKIERYSTKYRSICVVLCGQLGVSFGALAVHYIHQ